MPGEQAFHVGDPFALDGVRENHLGPTGMRRREGRLDGGMIVSIDVKDGPAEAAPLVSERFEIEHVLDAAEALDLVVIHESGQRIELVMTRKENRFPVGAFIELAITEDDVSAKIGTVALRRERQPAA